MENPLIALLAMVDALEVTARFTLAMISLQTKTARRQTCRLNLVFICGADWAAPSARRDLSPSR
jgi:hypothetical protein